MNPTSSKIKRAALAAAIVLAAGMPYRVAAQSARGPVDITPRRRQLIGVTIAAVARKNVDEQLDTTGNIEVDERLEANVQTRFAGWIGRVFADQTYQYVRRGQPLFTIYSPDLVSAEQEYLIALDSESRMRNGSLPIAREGAFSLVDAAAERLRLWGVPAREIARLRRDRTARREIEIDSPASGYVAERNALPGMYAQPETKLFAINALSSVWVYAAVFQNEIGKVRVGDAASIAIDAYPGEKFSGRVDYIWPQIDPATRTAKVRCELRNHGNMLFPGMFARVRLNLPLGRQTVVPENAVLRTGMHDLAFIDRGGGYFEPVELALGPRAGDEFIVLKGLKPGDRVAGSAMFLIDSESQLQAAAGAFAPPPPGVSANAAQPESANAASISLATMPSPLARGRNHLTIKLRDGNGRPIDGADVKVTFYMAAMPAMGMAAMRDEAAARETGGGDYAADINLQSGGVWAVTITASKNGKTIAAKQTEMSASGGM